MEVGIDKGSRNETAGSIDGFPGRSLYSWLNRSDFPCHDSDVALAAIRLLVFTGARLGEILTLRWSQIDMKRGVAILPDSKTGQKRLYFNEPAMEVLTMLPRLEENPA